LLGLAGLGEMMGQHLGLAVAHLAHALAQVGSDASIQYQPRYEADERWGRVLPDLIALISSHDLERQQDSSHHQEHDADDSRFAGSRAVARRCEYGPENEREHAAELFHQQDGTLTGICRHGKSPLPMIVEG
jgi:hypothetical protein